MSVDLRALPLAQRADLLYRAARSELDQRLWRAALSDAGAEPLGPKASGSAAGLLDLDGLVAAFAAEEAVTPTLAPGPVRPLPRAVTADKSAGSGDFRAFLEAAAARTGLAPALLASIVDAEAARRPDGGWDPASRNPRSTAAGLGQFLAGTWIGEARRAGSWLHSEAWARGLIDERGNVRDRAGLLALRFDPRISIEAIADHAATNLRQLARAGVAPGDLPGQARAAYLAHHLGISDARRFLGQGLSEERAGRLLAAQVGHHAAGRRIAAAGNAADAHRAWLLDYVSRKVRPEVHA